ncbi:MAG: transglycosylase SLT domain-containing protein [Myxococcales bacterium]|nr:transglycosylase SLT domain-containing protein [Myxococcales bacterium]
MRPRSKFSQPARTHVISTAVWLVAGLSAGVSIPAQAGPLCRAVMLNCFDGANSTGMNLRRAIGSKALSRWALKNCQPVPNSPDPYRCDWKKTLRTRRTAAPRAVKPTPTPAQARAPNPTAAHHRAAAQPRPATPQPPVPRRDVRGRYSTTPAPARLPKVTAKDRAPFAAEVQAAAARYRLPANLIRAVMKVESGYNPTVVSHAGAVGLMQLLPTTAKAMGVKDLRDPAQSILGGARFIRILANRFRGDLVKVLSAYHAGSTRVKRRGGTPYAATDSYVRKVLGVYYALADR